MLEPLAVPDRSASESSSWAFHGAQVSTRILAAARGERGGDWCEAFDIGNGVIALSIGDVCGHGEEKYAAMQSLRDTIREAALQGFDPARALAEAHALLRRNDPDEYATALLAFLNIGRHKLTFANAGHPPPLMCSAEGHVYLDSGGYDPPLGIEDAFVPALRGVDVPEATLLVLYTDGVTEHDRKPLHGEAELRAAGIFAYNFPSLPPASVIERQMGLMGSNDDDVAILTVWMPRLTRRSNA